MTAKFSSFARMASAHSDAMLSMSGFNGFYKGLAANRWWGGGGSTGVGNGFMVPTDDSDRNDTMMGHRMNVMNDGTRFWYGQNTGDNALEQRITEEWIDHLADSGCKCINPFYYSRTQDLVSYLGIPLSEKIWHWFDRYMTARNKKRLKFAVAVISLYASFDENSPTYIPVSVGTWLNLPTMADYWASLAQDPQYLTDRNGKPIVYLFNTSNAWDTTHVAIITAAFNARGLPTPTYVNQNLTAGGGANQITAYGPNSALVGTHLSWKTRADKDVANDATPGVTTPRQVGITLLDDGRPTRGLSTWWIDSPTYTEIFEHWKRRFLYARSKCGIVPDAAVYAYAAMELAEGGAVMPSITNILRGPNSPSKGPILDALHNLVYGNTLMEYVDHYHADTFHADVSRTQTWNTVTSIHNGGAGAPAPYEFKSHQSSASGATWTITPAKRHRRFRVKGDLGAAFGSFTWRVNGGSSVAVNQASSSTNKYGQVLIDTGDLGPGFYQLEITRQSGNISFDEPMVDISIAA